MGTSTTTRGDVEGEPFDAGNELPVIHGYFREHIFMGAREKADIRARMAKTAARLGFVLGKVFEEKVETAPEALGALLDAAVGDHAAVVVPGLEHLAIHGHATEMRRRLAEAVGHEVIIADE